MIVCKSGEHKLDKEGIMSSKAKRIGTPINKYPHLRLL